MIWFMNFMKPTEAEAKANAQAEAAPMAAAAAGMSFPDTAASVDNMVAMAQMQLMGVTPMMQGPPVAKAPSYQPKINLAKNPAMKNPALVAATAKMAANEPQRDVPMMGIMKAKGKGPVPVGMQSTLSPPIQKATNGPLQPGMIGAAGVKAGWSKPMSAMPIPVVPKPTPPAKPLCLQFEMGGCPQGDACPLSHVLPP